MTAQTLLDAWVDGLHGRGARLPPVAPDLVLLYFPWGSGGEARRLQGRDALVTWMERQPPGRYRFRAEPLAACPPDPELPEGDLAFQAEYLVEVPSIAWHNRGLWTFHVRAGALCGVRHEPQPIDRSCGEEPGPGAT